MNESFIRQRRNLLVTGIILFLISFAGIEIGENIEVFGNKFTIIDPIVIYICVWLMLCYFLVRYIPYFFDLEAEHRDYGLSLYPWGGFGKFHIDRPISIFTIIALVWTTITFLFQNILGIVSFLFQSIFHKNFTETLFPLLFTLFVILTSYNAPLMEENKALAFSKINKFVDEISDRTYGQVTIYFNTKIWGQNTN
ncbi:MAG: hypothetical protein M0P43_00670 [Arcobacteraceae bacterium]|nr:hypothetical protein [Arcobacteraceae bacterium]